MSDLEDVDHQDHTLVSYTSHTVSLLFAKSAVYVHPTPRSRDNIGGFIALSRLSSPSTRDPEAAELLLSWQSADQLRETISKYSTIEQDTSANVRVPRPPYQPDGSTFGFCLPLHEIAQLSAKPPRAGWSWGSLVITKTDGEQLPALFFHDDECISTIAERKHRQESFDPFGEEGHVFWGFDSLLTVLRAVTDISKNDASAGTYTLNPLRPKPPTLAIHDQAKPGVKWRILERFGRITRMGRSTADQLLDSDAGREILSRLPPQIRQMVASQQAQRVADEYDSARLYLARWAASISDASAFAPPSMATATDETFEEETALGMFEVLSVSEVQRRAVVTEKEWKTWFNPRGVLLKSSHEVRDELFHGSCEHSIMGEVWCFLLGVYPWDSDLKTRRAIAASKRDEYYLLKRKWFDHLDAPSSQFIEERHRIEKDIHRTDRQHPFFEKEDMPSPDPTAEWGTNAHMEQLKDILLTYNEYNAELGYVQGMSDLLAPIYVVSGEDGLAFWNFVGLMARTERNFLRDQSGMRTQLSQLAELTRFMLPKLYAHLEKCESLNFFAFFRMLLILFKREFEFDTILDLWTVIFTDFLSHDFHIFCALAILDLHSTVIVNHLRAFDEVLKYMNDLSGRMKLDEILLRAEKLYRAFIVRVREMDKRRQRIVDRKNEGHRQNESQSTAHDDSTTNSDLDRAVDSLTLSENLARLIGRD
ncbi:GTPase activating protein [Savitreella phatthalungensis]